MDVADTDVADEVCSAHAEVIPVRQGDRDALACLLRTRGGDPWASASMIHPVMSAPHTRR